MKLFLLIASVLFSWCGMAQTIHIKKDTLGSSTITFHTTIFGKTDSSVSFINVHENESTSVEAAKAVLEPAHKYALTELQFKSGRFISFSYKNKDFTVDPNRMYTIQGCLASLKKNSHHYKGNIFEEAAEQVLLFSKHYTDTFVDPKKAVVALHNNTEGEPLSIINFKSGNESKNAADVYMNLQKDPDDFFLTTDKTFFNFIKQKGFNVVLQNNETVEDDGSLSVYAGKKKIPYINIEAQVGHLAEQKRMVEIVLELISREVKIQK